MQSAAKNETTQGTKGTHYPTSCGNILPQRVFMIKNSRNQVTLSTIFSQLSYKIRRNLFN
jgi:hypothetical protein